MSVNILLKRSSTASKRPVAASMAFGELNLNYDAATGGLFYKDSLGAVVKVGPCQVSTTAPNVAPAGSAGNSVGEFWFDTSSSTLKLYNGTSWVEAGGSVQGVTGTSPVTVDNTDPLNPVVGVNAASTTAPGAVQLNDTVSSTSTTEALTANQGRNLQQQIDALIVSSNLTLAGTLDASTGFLVTVTTEGTAQGFAVGSVLPSPAAGNAEFFVIATTGAASYTPPGGSATEVHVGDWFLSSGTVWNFLDVGFQAAYATTASPGVVQLATDAEVQAGVNVDHAVTPSGLQSKVSDSVNTTSSTTLASSTAVKTANDAAGVAQSDADAAQLTANQAVLDAAAAQATADQAALDAAAAQATADQAVLDAAAAQGDATQALADAAAAQSAADQAALDAAAAQATADQAVLDAAAAQATADAAMPKAGGTFSGVVTFDQAPVFPVGVNIGPAAQVTYDNATSGLTATNVQAALDELAGEVDGVQGVTGTAPVTVDNTDPANPVVGVNAASTSAAGVVQLNDTVTSTSTTEAATANAVKAAYDAAVAAQTNGPLTSDTVLYVNCTDGNNATAARGTDRPFATVAAALAAASEGDTIFLSAGTFTENFTISKGVHLAGVFCDQATWSGTKILGNVVVNLVGAGVIRNLAVSDIYFISANSTSPVSITGMSPGAGGINTFTNCTFTQQTVTDTAQFAFQTSGTWTRSVYLRNCSIDGNFRHNAGTAAGASGYIVIDELLGVGNSNMYHAILTGTVEYRNPSNTLASIYQTGGVVLVNNASAGITANGATTSAIFGGTGFSYKGTAAAVGVGTIYFQGGSNQGTGKVDVGANVIYGWTNLTIDPANLIVNVAAVAYTTVVPSAANAQSVTQQRPRLDLLKTTSSVAAANQLATVIDSATGAIYSVNALDAGVY